MGNAAPRKGREPRRRPPYKGFVHGVRRSGGSQLRLPPPAPGGGAAQGAPPPRAVRRNSSRWGASFVMRSAHLSGCDLARSRCRSGGSPQDARPPHRVEKQPKGSFATPNIQSGGSRVAPAHCTVHTQSGRSPFGRLPFGGVFAWRGLCLRPQRGWWALPAPPHQSGGYLPEMPALRVSMCLCVMWDARMEGACVDLQCFILSPHLCVRSPSGFSAHIFPSRYRKSKKICSTSSLLKSQKSRCSS